MWHVLQTCEVHCLCLQYTSHYKQQLFPFVPASRNAEFYCEVRRDFYTNFMLERVKQSVRSYFLLHLNQSNFIQQSVRNMKNVSTYVHKNTCSYIYLQASIYDVLQRMFLEMDTDNILPFSGSLIGLSKPPFSQ